MEWLDIYYNLGCIPADEMKFVLKHLPGKVTYKVRHFYKRNYYKKLVLYNTRGLIIKLLFAHMLVATVEHWLKGCKDVLRTGCLVYE